MNDISQKYQHLILLKKINSIKRTNSTRSITNHHYRAFVRRIRITMPLPNATGLMIGHF